MLQISKVFFDINSIWNRWLVLNLLYASENTDMQSTLCYAMLYIIICPPNRFLNWIFWALCLNIIILLMLIMFHNLPCSKLMTLKSKMQWQLLKQGQLDQCIFNSHKKSHLNEIKHEHGQIDSGASLLLILIWVFNILS